MGNPGETETGWVLVWWRRAAHDGDVQGTKVHRWAEKSCLVVLFFFFHTLLYTPLAINVERLKHSSASPVQARDQAGTACGQRAWPAPHLLDDYSGRWDWKTAVPGRDKKGFLRSQATWRWRWRWWEEAVARCFQKVSSPCGPNSPGGAQLVLGLLWALSPSAHYQSRSQYPQGVGAKRDKSKTSGKGNHNERNKLNSLCDKELKGHVEENLIS